MTMSEMKRAQFAAALDQKIKGYQADWRQFKAEGREEEAVLVTIRLNIYEVLKTMYSHIQKGNTDQDVSRLFPAKVQQISQGWQAAREKAAEQGNDKKMRTESEKLETAAEILGMFYEIW